MGCFCGSTARADYACLWEKDELYMERAYATQNGRNEIGQFLLCWNWTTYIMDNLGRPPAHRTSTETQQFGQT